jgi:hypothetical protein
MGEEQHERWRALITFMSLNTILSFEVSANTKESVEHFLFGLYEVLGDNETQKVSATQKNTPEIKNGIIAFVEEFKNDFPKTINQIPAFFKKLEDDEYFLFLPFIELNFESSCKMHNYLMSLSSSTSLNELNDNFDKLFGGMLTNYNIFSYGDERRLIGNKQNRLCRFCNKNSCDTTFKNTAHAISEGMGNRKIFLYDECDLCNEKFSIEIEPDLINFYSLFRTFYKVKGKKGGKKIKGENFEVENIENLTIKLTKGDVPISSETEYNLPPLINNQLLNSQDVYRCLCKFVISVIDEQYLKYFGETIKWINKEISISQLPKIGELISYTHFTLEPKLYVYIRKSEDYKLPFMIGEFHFTCKIVSFIIPLSINDKRDFLAEHDFESYWQTFKHYAISEQWVFNDFSNNNERVFSLNLEFTMKKDSD